MATTHHLDNGQIRLTFLKRAADTNGELLEMEAIYRPVSSAPPAHYHPNQEETFEILSGALHVEIDGQATDVGAGERIVIPPGAVHRMHNAGTEEARVIWQTRPALRTEQFFETLYGLAMEGKANRQGVPNILRVARIMHEHAAEFVLARPSRPVQRIVFGVLAPLARAVGW
jgi:mannose-6-phosphate isomerase-like protein (cupin superfamily)